MLREFALGLNRIGILTLAAALLACGDTSDNPVSPVDDAQAATDTPSLDTTPGDAAGDITSTDVHTAEKDVPVDIPFSDTEASDIDQEDGVIEPVDVSLHDVTDTEETEVTAEEVIEDIAEPVSELNVFFTAPFAGSTIEINQPFDVVVLAKDLLHGPEALKVVISSSIEGELTTLTPDFAGWASTQVTLTTPGWHKLSAIVINPDNEEYAEEIEIGLCSYGQPEAFDAGLVDPSWKVYGDAYFDNDGWLEMTGNSQGKHGAIYNVGEKVNPGDVELSFKIWTGDGLNSGADGFAMSVINVPTVFDLEEVIDMGASGGCLGYGVSGNCGPLTVDAFHIEFDTWKNDGNPNFDPSAGNHIAITLDGDPSNHVFWETVMLEDAQWHEVVVKIVGQNITVHFDGELIIQGDLPTFQFHGGFIGFSGTTGWATNYHRFDDLHVKQACEVP